ncbi:hypothetical protein GCM10010191_70380 [Actinomadura vinacea]|uniref:Uncharacterized protein n=1 Tax=Actinomadura vinacea TaxID=115336 RepID=A0ABN3K1E3_9ACTN
MPKRIEVPDNDPTLHLDDVMYDAIDEANRSGESVTVVYGHAEERIEPGTKENPAAITGRLLDPAER